MNFQTFTIIAGSESCNAKCPFCISKMTLPLGVPVGKPPEVNWRNFRKACLLAYRTGVTTVLITGKGEPTLFPDQITEFMEGMEPFDFPLIEMQTNGIMIAENPERYGPYLRAWYDLGMTTIAISIVHYEKNKNKEIYVPYKKDYIELPDLIGNLRGYGFSVRLTCILANGFIDSAPELLNLIDFARQNSVDQLTVTPVNKPGEEESRNLEAWGWTNKHGLTPGQTESLEGYIRSNGTKLWTLVHGAEVYDFRGQNLCYNNCLTIQSDSDSVRNLIFYPDGHLRTYWQYPGSIIL